MKVYVGYWNHRHGNSKPTAAFSSEGKAEEWQLAKQRQRQATNPSAPIPEWVELTIDDAQGGADMHGIARDVGDDVAKAIDKHWKNKPSADAESLITLAVCGSYLIAIAHHGDEVIVEARIPYSLLTDEY